MDEPIAAAIGGVCLVFTGLVVVLAVFSSRRRRREQDSMRQWADRNGWTFTVQPGVDWGRRLPGGNRRGIGYAFSAVLGGRRVTVAEYSVTDASDGTSTNTHHYVVTVALLNRPYPLTEVIPRGPASRLKSRVLGAGETATGNLDFDHRFRLRTAEPADLRQRFSPALIAAHLGAQVPTPWSVQGNELLCHRQGRLQVAEIAGHATTAVLLADLLEGNGGRQT